MTFPVRESVTVTTFTSLSATHNVSMPATVNAGDILIVIVAFRKDSGSTTMGTTPSGWTARGTWTNTTSGGNTPGGIYTKTADGSEGGTTVNFPTSATIYGVAQCIRVSGGDGMSFARANVENSYTNTKDPPNVTASWGSDDNLWIAGFSGGADYTRYLAGSPSGFTGSTFSMYSGSGVYAQACHAYIEEAASSKNPSAFSIGGNFGGQVYGDVWTLAIQPGAAVHEAASSDAAEASDSQASQRGVPAASSEAAASAGQNVSQLDATAGIAEVANAGESQSGDSSLLAATVDSAQASDSQAPALSAYAAASSPAQADGASTAVLSAPKAISDAAAAADTQVGSLALAANDSNAANASDSQATRLMLSASTADAVAASDGHVVAVTRRASLVESATAAAQQLAQLAAAVAILAASVAGDSHSYPAVNVSSLLCGEVTVRPLLSGRVSIQSLLSGEVSVQPRLGGRVKVNPCVEAGA